MATTKITAAGIGAAISQAQTEGRDVWLSDDASERGAGRLQFRAQPKGGHRFYWRYSAPDGSKPRIALGPYSADAREGALTLKEARAAAAEKAALYRKADSRDVRAFLAAEAQRIEAEKKAAEEAAAEAERQRRAAIAAEQTAAEARAKYTLQALFDAYTGHLRNQGKQAAYDAENIFRNHVTVAHPEAAAMPANAVLARDVVALLRPLTEAGKGRTAAKLRSYLRAAYALAARAALDSDAPAAFLPFAVESNPVQDTGALSKYSRALERALSAPELAAYWEALEAAPADAAHDALRLLLLLGGQRPAQLLRATVADVDTDGKLLTLRDPKGKRAQARLHVLPLTEAAAAVVARCLKRASLQAARRAGRTGEQGPQWLFSSHGGAPLRPETVTQACADIAAALLKKPDGERIVQTPFQLRDLRRTAETRLAALGISRDLRAQIQSHGLGGVQARHYDKHDYMTEKAAALEAWSEYLETKPAANVAPIRGGRRARR